MKAKDIFKGGIYSAMVNGRLSLVRVDKIRTATLYFANQPREVTVYDVTNLATGRKTTFNTPVKFRYERLVVRPPKVEAEQRSDPTMVSEMLAGNFRPKQDTSKTVSPDCTGFDPSLVTGLCRCTACRTYRRGNRYET